jgi:hypothetical protein
MTLASGTDNSFNFKCPTCAGTFMLNFSNKTLAQKKGWWQGLKTKMVKQNKQNPETKALLDEMSDEYMKTKGNKMMDDLYDVDEKPTQTLVKKLWEDPYDDKHHGNLIDAIIDRIPPIKKGRLAKNAPSY